ncbi:MAG: anthranilate phosphoribosyltransferase [Acidobacteriota bacterium]
MAGLSDIASLTELFRGGADLKPENCDEFLDLVRSTSDEAALAGMFAAWNTKGIAEDEIFGLASAMRKRCIKVTTRHENFVDIVGTGGSSVKTFNVSTAAAFVAAGAGVPVAKHGNRAATSGTGSADVLFELGVTAAADPATAERCLNKIGICFMFAPNFHSLSPILARVRRGLGFPTIFNCVGPLCNPAGAPFQLIGVWDKDLVPKMAGALTRLGTRRSWIVHGLNGLDEISLSGPTLFADVCDSSFTVGNVEFPPGVGQGEQARATSFTTKESADLIRRIVTDQQPGSAEEATVLVNAMAAIFLSRAADDLSAAYGMAVDSIRSGNAGEKLEQLIMESAK